MKRDFSPAEFDGLHGVALGKRLAEMGYRRVSNRFRIVSRVDRPDWKMDNGHGHTLDADYYRRVVSQDCIEGVPGSAFVLVPNSTHDATEYVEVTRWRKPTSATCRSASQ